MRLVLDTNVLVSALLTPGGPPARILSAVLAREAVALVDGRILEEYREVLFRPRLKIDALEAARVLDFFETSAELVTPVPLDLAELPDPDDLSFLEVAVVGRTDALVTGNRRHFPDTRGVPLLSPRELVERMPSRP